MKHLQLNQPAFFLLAGKKLYSLLATAISLLLFFSPLSAQNVSYNLNSVPVVGTNNSAFGWRALRSNTTGANNIANGKEALYSNTSGNSNAANGFQSLFANTTGSNNVANGYAALFGNTTGDNNTASGYKALFGNTIGGNNAAFGSVALLKNTTGTFNTAVGVSALSENITGYDNTAIGSLSLISNTAGNYNTAIGKYTLLNNITGSNNTALGYNADVTSGDLTNATAIGYEADVTTSNAIQLGNDEVTKVFAGKGTAATLIAGGLQITGGILGAGKVLTSDANGVATWQAAAGGAGWSLTGNAGTVDAVNFIGTTDNVPFNIRVNNQKAGRIDPALQNAFYGFRAGNSNTTGNNNVAIGEIALFSNTIGQQNTAIGYRALYPNTTGEDNTAVGFQSLNSNTTGSQNTAIGYFSDVTSGSLFDATALGSRAKVNASNKVRIGSTTVTVIEGQVMFTPSDGRFKNNISESDVKGLEFIKRLRPVVYNFDSKKFEEFLIKNMPESVRTESMQMDFAPSTAIRQSGFIAQEVEKAAQETGYNFNGVHTPDNADDNYSIAYSQFVVPLVKGMQEQQKMIEQQQQQIDELKKLVTTLAGSSNPAVKSSTIALNDKSIIVLDQNTPNPFSNQTTIAYSIPQNAGTAQVLFYDAGGRLVKTANITNKGKGQLNVFASDLSKGSYSYTLVVDGKVITTKKMVKQ